MTRLFRKASFFKVETALKVDEITNRLTGVQNRPRAVPDKNSAGKRITLKCEFRQKKVKDGNYVLGVRIEYQIRPRTDMEYQKAQNYFIFVFFPRHDLLAVLGSDDAMRDAVNVVQEALYPDVDDRAMFRPATLEVDSVVETIKEMKKDDPYSWCSDYGGIHDGPKYQDKKTKSNFSLEEGKCVLEDPEALDAIAHSSAIAPKYKFYTCPKLSPNPYTRPKSMQFNGKRGTVTIFIPHEFEHWYGFIWDFLLDSLVFR